MNAEGDPVWTPDGVPVCVVSSDLELPKIAADGVGGAIVVWADVRSATQAIYAQRLNGAGAPEWTVNGTVVAGPVGGSPRYPNIIVDPAGMIVSFTKGLNDIYAQRLSASGTVQWVANGVPICTGTSPNAHNLVTDGGGGALIAWEDTRSGSIDIYAQRVTTRGDWGHPDPVLASVTDVPMDQGGRVAVDWLASGWDAAGLGTITHYSLWRQASPGAGSMAATAPKIEPSQIGPEFAGSGHRLVAGLNGVLTTWEFLATVPTRYASKYRYTATTLSDSMVGNPADETFQVLAHTSDPFLFFESKTVAGHSVDNLAPAAPLGLTAQRVGPDVHLRWSRVSAADLRDYSIYRATSSGVTPVAGNFLATTGDTIRVDQNPPESTLYYIVTAHDIHGNQSAASNQAIAAPTTGAPDIPSIATFAVLQNYPNPFAGVTEFRVGLAVPSDITIELFNVSGRRVSHRRIIGLSPGWQTVSFDAREGESSQLTNGVYCCRFTAAGATVTRKMTILR
jgi:hypothetical protein